jgi:hypothetical protein
MVEVKETLARLGASFCRPGRVAVCNHVVNCPTLTDGAQGERLLTYNDLAMKSIRYLRTSKYINARRIINLSPLGTSFRRMAHFYNVDVAGLTDEQAEVCNPLRKKTLIVLYDLVQEYC